MRLVAKHFECFQYLWKRCAKMLFKTRNSQIVICLLVMGLALARLLLPNPGPETHQCLIVTRILQFIATVVMLFGILKAHPKHKAYLMLFWLLSTATLMFALFIFGSTLFIKNYSYPPITIWMHLFVNAFSLTATAFIGYLFVMMYHHYVELTQGAVPPESEVEAPANEEPVKSNGQVTVLITHPKFPAKA